MFFVALFPYFALEGDGTSAGARRAGCLLPPTCLALGTLAFAEYEDSGEVRYVTSVFSCFISLLAYVCFLLRCNLDGARNNTVACLAPPAPV